MCEIYDMHADEIFVGWDKAMELSSFYLIAHWLSANKSIDMIINKKLS
jgi:hypothetical protein